MIAESKCGFRATNVGPTPALKEVYCKCLQVELTTKEPLGHVQTERMFPRARKYTELAGLNRKSIGQVFTRTLYPRPVPRMRSATAQILGTLREILILDPDGQQIPPVAYNTFDECPFPSEVLDEVWHRSTELGSLARVG